MKGLLRRAVLALLLLLVADCALARPFAYVTNRTTNSVSGLAIDGTTGALVPVPGSPFATGTEPTSVAVTPGGEFAYVTNFGSPTISAYSVNAVSGALAPLAGSPFAGAAGLDTVIVTPNGAYAYVISEAVGVLAFAINPGTGALTAVAGSPFAGAVSPTAIAVSPNGNFAYTANSGSNSVSAWRINPDTGALAAVAGSPFAGGDGPFALTVTPNNAFLYVANIRSADLSGYAINAATGALTPVAGSPYALPANAAPEAVVVSPNGKFAYVADEGVNKISAFSINAANGALAAVAGSPFGTGATPVSLAMSPGGGFVYAANHQSDDISGYRADPESGALSVLAGSRFGGVVRPSRIAIASTTDPSLLATDQFVTIVSHQAVPARTPGNVATALGGASCPAGMAALSGGVHVSDPSQMVVTTSAPMLGLIPGGFLGLGAGTPGSNGAPVGWYAFVASGSPSPQVLDVAVVCGVQAGVVTMVAEGTVTAHVQRSLNATCPAGTVATGGGVDNVYRDVMYVTASAPIFPGASPYVLHRTPGAYGAAGGWVATSYDVGGADGSMRVAAICAPLAGTVTVIAENALPPATHSNMLATCPAGMFALGGGIDVADGSGVIIVGSEPALANEPIYIAGRAAGVNESARYWLGSARNTGPGTQPFKTAVICAFAAPLPTVVEFYNADLDNYFITADPVEQASVDSGVVGHWTRTGRNFRSGGLAQVCRFYGNANFNPATGRIFGPNSHFYTASESECAGLIALYSAGAPAWHFESRDFRTTPVGADGTCPLPTQPVYRAYNNGFARHVDSNHRITTDPAAIDAVVARGWIREGIVMCAAS